VEACDELLSKPLIVQQWVEEADRDDPLIPLRKDYKAFSYYHLPDGRVVGLWKNALTSISRDEGRTWVYNPLRAPKFVNSNAKIWGQKTSDGKYVTVYNPSEFRWPLALSVSDDGLNYKNLLLVNADFPRMKKNMLSKEQQKKNEALADKYDSEGAFPLTLLLTPEGEVVKKWEGLPSLTAEEFTNDVKAAVDANR